MNSRVKQYLLVGIGGLLGAISINVFLIPHHLLSGGVSGIAIILHFLYDFPVGLQIIAMNIPLMYLAWQLIGKEYVLSTIYGMLVFSLSVDATGFLADINFIDDPLLAAVYGGVLSGLGSGLIFRMNGSAGGLDIVVAIVKRYYALNMGSVGFAVNCLIMLVAALFFGAKPAMLTLISMFITGNVTDKVVEGFNRKKTVMIITENAEEVAEMLMNEVSRGATFLQGEGAFTRQNKKVIFIVVNLMQIAKIKLLIEEIDPCAFMIVQDAAEVMGRGFTLPKQRITVQRDADLPQGLGASGK
jgi:uncharacterized membrane-anchored protein YitT (DUF2179 family)